MNYGKRKLPSTFVEGESNVLPESLTDDMVKRKFRNLSEKKRRDQFNMLINELSAIVCSGDLRRVDKTTVLEQAINFLENHQSTETAKHDTVSYNWKPSFLSLDEFIYLLLEALDCVILALNEGGYIKYASDNAQQKIGVTQNMVNTKGRCNEVIADAAVFEKLFKESKQSSNRISHANAQLMCFPCEESRKFQLADLLCIAEMVEGSYNHSSQVHEVDKKDIVFNTIVQLKVPSLSKEFHGPSDISFKSKYSLEWKILHMENKASAVLGFQPYEILGSSGYDFCHPQDMEILAATQKKLIRTGCSKTSLYRMLTKSHGWVWLQSDFYMCYNQWSGKPEHIQATHSVVSSEEVDAYKQNGSLPEADSSPSSSQPYVLNHVGFSPSPSTDSLRQIQASKRDIYSSQLADIGINRNRDMNFSRMQQAMYLDTAPISSGQTLLSPKNLNPAQKKLHTQLALKYRDLKASVDRQQADLTDLLAKLNNVSIVSSSPTSCEIPNSEGDLSAVSRTVHRQPSGKQTVSQHHIYPGINHIDISDGARGRVPSSDCMQQ